MYELNFHGGLEQVRRMAREIVKWFILCFPFFFSTFNYCFIYLIKHLTVIYFLSDTVKLGRPFIIKII